MSNLTYTAYRARQVIKYGSLGFVGLFLLWFVGSNAIKLWRVLNPPPLPPPTEDFGELEPIKFPKSEKLKYDLQTPDGEVGEFTTRIRVFYSPAQQSSFMDAQRATELARNLDFLFEPEHPREGLYRWRSNSPLPTTLEVQIATGDFTMKKRWQSDPGLLQNKRFISDQQAVIDAQNFLRKAGVLKKDLNGNEKVSYYKASGSKLVEALSLSEADFVRVDFFRSKYQQLNKDDEMVAEYKFYSTTPSEGMAYVLLSGSEQADKKIIAAEYDYRSVEYDQGGEYALKSAQKAWGELQAGEGFVASYEGVGRAVIRRVKLGYLDPLESSDYVKPVFVFTGDEGLVAYVSALLEEVEEE